MCKIGAAFFLKAFRQQYDEDDAERVGDRADVVLRAEPDPEVPVVQRLAVDGLIVHAHAVTRPQCERGLREWMTARTTVRRATAKSAFATQRRECPVP